MTIQELEDENLIILGRDGKPITKREREFLILIKRLEEKREFGLLLAIRTIMEAMIK